MPSRSSSSVKQNNANNEILSTGSATEHQQKIGIRTKFGHMSKNHDGE
jgi:hypothetical protein